MNSRTDPLAFSLIDLLILLALLVLLGTAGLERLDGVSAKSRLHAAAETLRSEMNRARGLAISHNLTVRFELRAPPLEYGFAPPSASWTWKSLGPGIELQGPPRRGVDFHSRGTAAPAGTLEISNPAGRARIVVNVAGRIRVEEEYVR